MTFDNRLGITFKTLDCGYVRDKISKNYMVKVGVTTLIDNLRRSSIVIFDEVNQQWKDRDRVIDTTQDRTLLPFKVLRAFHEVVAMKCSCSEYADWFNHVVDSVANAYILTMIPVEKKQKINKLEASLIPLELHQKDALSDVQDAARIIVDNQLEDLKKEVTVKNKEIADLKQTILDLNALQMLRGQTASWLSTKVFGNREYEENRQQLLTIVNQQNVYTNDLITTVEIQLTLNKVNFVLQNLNTDKTRLDQDITTHEDQNNKAQQAKEFKALKALALITKQIDDIKNQIAVLNT